MWAKNKIVLLYVFYYLCPWNVCLYIGLIKKVLISQKELYNNKIYKWNLFNAKKISNCTYWMLEVIFNTSDFGIMTSMTSQGAYRLNCNGQETPAFCIAFCGLYLHMHLFLLESKDFVCACTSNYSGLPWIMLTWFISGTKFDKLRLH